LAEQGAGRPGLFFIQSEIHSDLVDAESCCATRFTPGTCPEPSGGVLGRLTTDELAARAVPEVFPMNDDESGANTMLSV